MRSLLNFFIRYNNVILFLLLEGIAVLLLSSGTDYHNIKLSNAARAVEGIVQQGVSDADEYFILREINKKLSAENLDLRNELERAYSDPETKFFPVYDSVHRQQYLYSYTEVVKNSINRQKNFLTLNSGTSRGIDEGMAVTGPDGIVGVIVQASDNFAVAMSVLNRDFRLSARLKKNSYFGSLNWNGTDTDVVSLNEIPHHVSLSVGDTIETTGFSAVFPAGIMIGTIEDFDGSAGDFYDINVRLSTSFRKLDHVYVITNLRKGEQLDLESSRIIEN